MAKYLNSFPKNLTEYPNSFERQGAFPLDKYSVFTSLAAAEDYAKDAESVAYVGQPLAVVTTTTKEIELEGGETQEVIDSYITKYYLIGDVNGTLIELGTAGSEADLNDRLEAVEVFFESVDDKDNLVETLLELQNYIAEHGRDFTGLITDVKKIYTPYSPANEENGTPEIPESGYLVEKETQLRTEIQEIYDADGGEQGEATGLLPEEIARAKEKEQFILDFLFGKDNVSGTDVDVEGTIEHTPGYVEDLAKKVGSTDALVNGILGDFRGEYDEETSTYQYNTVAEFVKNATSVATTSKLGGVLSSDPNSDKKKDLVEVIQSSAEDGKGPYAGQMRVIDLNVNKLYQTEYLILDGGTATAFNFDTENGSNSTEG